MESESVRAGSGWREKFSEVRATLGVQVSRIVHLERTFEDYEKFRG